MFVMLLSCGPVDSGASVSPRNQIRKSCRLAGTHFLTVTVESKLDFKVALHQISATGSSNLDAHEMVQHLQDDV